MFIKGDTRKLIKLNVFFAGSRIKEKEKFPNTRKNIFIWHQLVSEQTRREKIQYYIFFNGIFSFANCNFS